MPKWCAVPNCRTGSKFAPKRSVFRVPKNIVQWKKWEETIPGIKKLNSDDVVCENHFEEKDIAREWIKLDADGRVIAQYTYKCPHLKDFAVPSKFTEVSTAKENCDPEHSYAKLGSSHRTSLNVVAPSQVFPDVPTAQGNCETEHSYPKGSSDVIAMSNIVDSMFIGQFPATKVVSVIIDTLSTPSPTPGTSSNIEPSCDHGYAKKNLDSQENSLSIVDIPRVPSPASSTDTVPLPCTMEVASDESLVVDSSTCQEPDDVVEPLEISKATTDTNASTDGDFSAYVPEGWAWSKMRNDLGDCTVFLYTVIKIDNSKRCPIVQKSVRLDMDGTMEYFVHGRPVDPQGKNLDLVLNKKENITDVLTKFRGMNVCSGLGDISIHVVGVGEAYQDGVDKWRSKGCLLLSKKKRCDSCTTSRKCIQVRAARLKKPPVKNRINNISNPVDRRKLIAMRMKIRRERRQKLRAQDRVKHLMTCLNAQKEQITTMKNTAIEKSLDELAISNSQKLVIREIIAAAKKKDARGRRYTDEWLMLCMLMNIRSPKDYEFLRKNSILPLPCTRTIRAYFSLINTKCGFDEEFAKLIEKHFASKSPLQRHGILLLDEINLRKSVAVCSRNLTYSGLTDFGDDGEKSTDIKEQATHGLVLMFQPLADTYTQPIAVFASKNPVKGEELAKIVVKAISYLEKCGAMIHGVVADGATTNAKMWSLLGVRGMMEDTKTWFTHPTDNERKVFVFSDICHVIKNVRNRLYNKRKLRTKSTKGYVRWSYFESLYDLDKDHPGNARACPKITNRHIVLDNTAKMRVRLATQIFSNSVADGLAFYLSHGCEVLRGCEETISFCKRFNDMFDAMNRKSPNEGLTERTADFKILEDSLRWLNEWESEKRNKSIAQEEFLTDETSRGLRISLQSTMELCSYLIDKFDFKYLLTGKVNQDNLEKFFGTIRQCAGCNDHPNAPTFLQLYKLLSVYSVIKPPKYGNCTVSNDAGPATLISIDEIKAIYGNKREGKSAEYLRKIKAKLDEVLRHDEWEADDVMNISPEHDYALSPILDCIIYYVTGYLCKQVLKKYKSCVACEEAVRLETSCGSSESQLVQIKSRGGLIHANLHFFHLIRHVETSFAKYSSRIDVFDATLDEVLDTYTFTFPCKDHASEILSYAIVYYIRLRMRQNAHQENLKLTKKFVVKKKLSKLTNE